MKTPTLGTSIIERSPLEGVRLFLYPTSTKDVVSLRGSFFGGMMHAQAVHPLASLFVARLLDKGTKRKSKEKIQHELEKRGIEISFSVSAQRIVFEVYCRAGVAHEAVRLLGEMIREPLFSETEFLNERVLFEGELQEEEGNTYARGAVMFSQRVFGPTHPGYLYSVLDKREYLQTLTLENVKAFYESVCGRGSLICVVVGDIDVRDIESYVRKEFQGLREVAIGNLESEAYKQIPHQQWLEFRKRRVSMCFLGSRLLFPYMTRHISHSH